MLVSFTSFDNKNLRHPDLKDFDFSCKTQVEVFDLSSGDAGNVRTAFVPYTSKFNDELVDYIFGIYKSAGIPTSASSSGAGGTTGSTGESTAGGSSSGCSCTLGGSRRAQGLGACLLGLGRVAWHRGRRRVTRTLAQP